MNSNLICTMSFTYKDLLLRKLYYSVICGVFSQILLLQFYILLVNLDFLHPIEWFSKSLSTFTSFTTWLFVVSFMVIIFGQSIICAKNYIFKPTYCSTRFQKFVSLFSMHNIIVLILHVFVGGLFSRILLKLGRIPSEHLIESCTGNKFCLVEDSFFLIVGGVWTGFYYFTKVHISKRNLVFPVIHQRKVLQLKSQIIPLFRSSASFAIWPTFYFIIIYYCWGATVSEVFKNIVGLLDINETEHRGIMIYIYLWLFSTLYLFSMDLIRFLFNVFLTDPVEFPLEKYSNDMLTLQESINMEDLPIIQNLACLDLFILSRWMKLRRQAFFVLSQPGGHPHNWNCLVENILNLFKQYIVLLNKSTEIEIVKPPQIVEEVGLKSSITSPQKFINLRNLSTNYVYCDTLEAVEVSRNPLPTIQFSTNILIKIKEKINNFWNVLKTILGINFLFGELPQANIQKCLGNGQLIIWTSQGIADLICASLSEDRYGIVQKDLPVIITTLVQLKQTLDKLNKVPALTRKIAGYDDFNYKMKGAVNLAVKRSLFNICRCFGAYLKDIPLNKDVMQHLQTFIICKN